MYRILMVSLKSGSTVYIHIYIYTHDCPIPMTFTPQETVAVVLGGVFGHSIFHTSSAPPGHSEIIVSNMKRKLSTIIL